MELASARELKALLTDTVLAPFTAEGGPVRTLAVAAEPLDRVAGPVRTLALGIASPSPGEFRLAVRYQRRELAEGREIELIRKKAKGEVDVRYIGRVVPLAELPWGWRRHRPLRLGTSIGHFQITAGTLGAVVRRRKDGATLLLSNAHVFANENKGKVGDAILQAGVHDGGKAPDDTAATLAGMVKLKKTGANKVDAAVAAPADGIEVDARTLKGLGKVAGIGPDFLDEGTPVTKLGRTTGLTRGRVRAFELDNLTVGFPILGNLRFDNQIEIEGEGADAFAAGGDSGSLIVDEERRAVALLFAAGDTGGANGQGLTDVRQPHPGRAGCPRRGPGNMT
ncbi:MAG TPA: hypothetical protein VKA46_24505 [Gemmataceae bacterium]|nr:hypothetical protein [Gemmataceae bacterium]